MFAAPDFYIDISVYQLVLKIGLLRFILYVIKMRDSYSCA